MHDTTLPAGFIEGCAAILGDAALVRDPEAIEPYVTDFWGQYRGVTPLVLRPGSTAEVAALVKLAAAHGVALVPQAGNTGLVVGGIPDQSGRQVVLSVQRLDRIRHVDPSGDHLVAEAGCVLAEVQAAAAGIGRLFPLSLGAEGSCRIGGNLSTNAGGVNVLRYGMSRALVLGLEVVLADGSVWNGLRPLRKDNTGYDLKQLFIGAEGTLGIITAAALKLAPAPNEVQTLWLGIDDPRTAVRLLTLFQQEMGELISSFELLTSFGVEAACEHLPGVRRPVAEPHPWHVLVEVAWSFPDGLRDRLEAVLEKAFEEGLVQDGTLAESGAQRDMMWRIREGQSEATRHMGFIVRSDVTVPISELPELIDRMQAWVGPAAPGVQLIPFGHVGDGNLHFNFVTPPGEVERLKPVLLDRLYEEVGRLAGSISAEHGIGRLKREAMQAGKSEVELSMMRRLKAAFDPQGILNPGVILKTE
ncbi:FAD-binding oxidoreductase [Geminicoccaceae bacterium 1502E]|nr:FAD-binding oxidoreductase [Geminicoccaceae bacterium 1502E]